jgi:hypothetical protein
MKTRYWVGEKEFIGPKGDKLKLTVKRGRRPSDEKERKPRRYPAAEALQLIYDALPEIAKIWEAVKTLPGSLSRNPKEAQKQAALDCFDKQGAEAWNWITRTALNRPEPWDQWRGGKEKGDFRGKLLWVLIFQRFECNYGAEHLEKIARDFETPEK